MVYGLYLSFSTWFPLPHLVPPAEPAMVNSLSLTCLARPLPQLVPPAGPVDPSGGSVAASDCTGRRQSADRPAARVLGPHSPGESRPAGCVVTEGMSRAGVGLGVDAF